ncbi:MAG: prephenate dehydratase [Ghiorsea sp.]|nr:prephenate dehydratase [Ghiorsea sp.]
MTSHSDLGKPCTNLDELRQAIDAVDDKVLQLIYERASLATKVGEHKKNQPANTPFYVPSREASIIRRLLDKNGEDADENHSARIPDEAIHGIFREIIGACLALEHPMTIAYLGPEGTFTHTAATRQFGSSANYMACGNLELVFDAVESGRATYGLVPVENAFAGAVTHTLDLFADFDRDTYICAEVQLSIHHHLFSHAEKMEDIKLVISHPQPLAQCHDWLLEHLPNATLMEASSTVHAANMIEEARVNSDAALDWQHAAVVGPYTIVDYTELPLLEKSIEDHHDNRTRFYVIGQHDSPPSGEDKTALVISTKDEPGALHKLIQSFASRDIGLTRIESRPSRKKAWEYVFFIDVLGHRDDVNVKAALEEIQVQDGVMLKVLGSCPISRKL